MVRGEGGGGGGGGGERVVISYHKCCLAPRGWGLIYFKRRVSGVRRGLIIILVKRDVNRTFYALGGGGELNKTCIQVVYVGS